MDTKETGERTDGADGEIHVSADELHDFLRGVHFIVGDGTDAASPSPWPGHDRPEPRRINEGEGLRVLDHVELGRLVADWAADPASRPSDAAELASQLRGAASLPDGIRTVEFIQDAPDTLTIRLPSVDTLEAGLTEFADPMRENGCPVPRFYLDQHHPGIGPMLTPADMFLARLGDVSLGAP